MRRSAARSRGLWALLALAACTGPEPAHPALAARLVALADTDGDGVVTTAEFDAGRLPGDTSPGPDTDGDGILGPVELERWFLQTSPPEVQQAAQRANRGPDRRGGGPPSGPARPPSASPAADRPTPPGAP